MSLIRPFESRDREDVRNIACETGFFGQPIDLLFRDRDLMADMLIKGYELLEPGHFWVAEEAGRAEGYLCGTLDFAGFASRYAKKIFPGLAWKYLLRGHWLNPTLWKVFLAEGKTGRQNAAQRKAIAEKYPANCHVNMLDRSRGRGIGHELMDKFVEQARAAQSPGIHIATGTDGGKAFFGKCGFEVLLKYPAPILPIPGPSEIWVMGLRL